MDFKSSKKILGFIFFIFFKFFGFFGFLDFLDFFGIFWIFFLGGGGGVTRIFLSEQPLGLAVGTVDHSGHLHTTTLSTTKGS